MAKQLQLRRGTTAQHSTFTGAVGEVTIDTDKDVVVVHDGSTAGGKAMVKEADTAYTIATVDDFGTVPVGYTTVIVKDPDRGGIFVWSASGTANGGTVFAGSSGYWVRQYSGAVNVKWFGAKGDGVTDDTIAIQNASKHSALITGGSYKYAVYAPIELENCNIISLHLNAYGAISSLINIKSTNISIKDSMLDCRNTSSDGYSIQLIGSSNGITNYGFDSLHVDNCRISNIHSCGVLIQADVLTNDKIFNNVITNNIIEGVLNLKRAIDHVTVGIYITNLNAYDTNLAGPDIQLRETYRTQANINRGHVITGNHVYLTRYGIAAHQASNFTISNNVCEFNTRGISIQTGSNNFTVSNNSIYNAWATGIHIGHCCAMGTINSNTIKGTTVGGDESAINLYYGLDNIVVSDNICDSAFNLWNGGRNLESTQPRYGVKLGQRCTNISIRNNILLGYQYGVLATSTIFNTTILPSDINYYNTGIGNIYIQDNIIQGAYYTSATGYKEQFLESETYGVWILKSADWEDTSLGGLDINNIYVNNSIESINYDNVIENRGNGTVTTPTKIVNTNFVKYRPIEVLTGIDKIATVINNSYKSLLVTTAMGATPSVKDVDFVILNYSTVNITYFTGGIDKQIIRIKMDGSTYIVHNSSYIRLKGGVNVKGNDANSFIELIYTSNIWFELSRNF